MPRFLFCIVIPEQNNRGGFCLDGSRQKYPDSDVLDFPGKEKSFALQSRLRYTINRNDCTEERRIAL